MTKLVLVQANPFFAFAEIDEPVADSFNQSEGVLPVMMITMPAWVRACEVSQ